MTQEEKQKIKTECEKCIQRNQKINRKFLSCSEADQEWVLDYLSSGKGKISDKMVIRFDSLNLAPKKEFFH